MPSDEIARVLEAAGVDMQEAPLETTLMAEIAEEKVRWLWRGRIPLGKMSIQDGEPNRGKSMVLLDIAARVSRGHAMPDNSFGLGHPATVIILASEDDKADTLVPRLRAADANSGYIEFLDDMIIPDDVSRLERLVEETKAALVIFDPLMAYLSEDTRTNSDASVRRALKPLGDMAQRTGAAIIFNRHLNKNSGSGASAMNRGGGSVGIGAAVRSGWVVSSFPDTPEDKYLAPMKWNLSAGSPTTLKFRIIANDEGLPHIDWLGDSGVNADQLVGASWTQGQDDRSAMQVAKDFILEQLREGVVFRNAKEILEEAEQDGIAIATLKRAKRELGIKSQKQVNDWIWLGPAWDGGKVLTVTQPQLPE